MSTPAPPPQDRPYGQNQPPPPGYQGAPQPYPGAGPSYPGSGPAYPYGGPAQPYGYVPPYSPDRRPGTVTAAAWITIVLSVLSVLAGIALAIGADALTKLLRENPEDFSLDGSELQSLEDARVAFVAIGIACVAGSLGAIALAVFVLKRHNWARIVLVVLSGITVAIGLLFTIAALIGIFWFVGGIAVIVMLFVGGANQWFSREPAPGAPPAGPQPYQGW